MCAILHWLVFSHLTTAAMVAAIVAIYLLLLLRLLFKQSVQRRKLWFLQNWWRRSHPKYDHLRFQQRCLKPEKKSIRRNLLTISIL